MHSSINVHLLLGGYIIHCTCILFNFLLSCRSIIGQDFAGFKDNLLALVYAMPFVSINTVGLVLIVSNWHGWSKLMDCGKAFRQMGVNGSCGQPLSIENYFIFHILPYKLLI